MSQPTSAAPSRKKTTFSLLVLAALTGIIVLLFKDHWAEITAALSQLSAWQVLVVLAIGLSYPLLEGCVAWVIVRSRIPGFRLRQGIDTAWCGTFGNVVTLGAGAVPVQTWYLHRCGLPVGPGVGLMTLQYVFHKTTHAAKLAKYFIKQGRRPMLVACDIYRPAAIDQLQVVGKQAGAPVFTLPGAKPPEIAKKALAHARDYGNDIVILDTAGRLQIDDVLMQELVDIKEAVPVDETLLVVDAMAGQDAVNVAKTFNEKVSIDGIILTKTDGDTRGGAALSVLAVTGKPIKFQGTGEKLDDLDVFHPDRMASRILGMGDVLSLIERAQETADEKAAEETAKRMMENKFDMNDMLDQFAQIRKMGGAGAMLSMLPGGSGIDPSQVDEKAFDRIEAMIYSMTKEEREKPSIINPKRKRRIAAGSGTTVADVNKLLKQFEMMQKMMKQFKKSPKGFARRLGGMMGNPSAFRGLK